MPVLAQNIINLLVGAALFIVGMSLMSSGLKKVAGKGVRKLFNKLRDKWFAGIGIGAGVTALIQSSGATSVMALGFINAGIMTIFQGICIILGAYIGTTVTGIIVSFSSFDFSAYLVLTIVIGVILSFFKKEKIKNIGEIFTGFGVLFFGLTTMKTAFATGSELLKMFQNTFEVLTNPILLLLIGALFTCLTQSSSATSGIVIVMVGNGAIGLFSGFYLVLGATIGTVFVTILGSLGGTIEAKRTAWICLFVRTLTALLGTIIVWIIQATCGASLQELIVKLDASQLQITLALFLVVYNLIFVPVVVPFIKPLIRASEKVVKDKSIEKKKHILKYIDPNMLISPSLAVGQVQNEIINMLDLSHQNFKLGYKIITTLDFTDAQELIDREDDIDLINNELTDFLITLSHDVTRHDEEKVGRDFHVINDIERIGDHAFNFYDSAKVMDEKDLKFSATAIKELKEMYDCIEKMFILAKEIFQTKNKKHLRELHDIEDETDRLKKTLSDAHFNRITKNQCTMELSPFYSTLVSELERVADHLVNIGYSIINPVGDTHEIKELKAAKNG